MVLESLAGGPHLAGGHPAPGADPRGDVETPDEAPPREGGRMRCRSAPGFATVAEAGAHQARRQFVKAQVARSMPDARPAAAGGSPPAGRLARCLRQAARLGVAVAVLGFFLWAVTDAWQLPMVERSWPSGRCVAVEPASRWTCDALPARYTVAWVGPEAARR